LDEHLRQASDIEHDEAGLRRGLKPRLIRYGHFQAATTRGPQVADDLQAAYVIDDPHSVTYASAEMLTRIAPADSELYALALANLALEPMPEPETVEFAGTPLTAYESTNFFVASQLLRLGEIVDLPAAGALVVIPTVQQLCVMPLTLAVLGRSLPHLSLFAQKSFAERPNACSPSVYWWSGGVIERVDISIEGTKVDVRPSRRFTEVLNTLAAR
jgi:hypothetical protein